MFVKNICECAVSTLTVIIQHDSQIYNGTAQNVPFYLLNEKVKELDIFSGNLLITI